MSTRQSILDHVLVPIANVEDAEKTAAALEPYEPGAVTVLYVVERVPDSIDPIPSRHLEEEGRRALDAFKEVFPDATEHLTHSYDLIDRVYEVADEREATAIAFRGRDGSRFIRLLSGDHALSLVDDPPLPVISLPDGEKERDSP